MIWCLPLRGWPKVNINVALSGDVGKVVWGLLLETVWSTDRSDCSFPLAGVIVPIAKMIRSLEGIALHDHGI